MVLQTHWTGGRALLVTGEIGAGKTRAALSLADDLQRHGLRVGGVASPRVLAAGQTLGYRVQDLATGEEHPLCRDRPPGIPFRRFFFSREGLAFANAALERAAREGEAIVVDEVGPLELGGGGFAPGLKAACESRAFLVLTVRPSLASEVRRWAELEDAPLFPLPRSPGRHRSLDQTRQLFDDSASNYGSWTGGAGPLTGYADSLARAAELARIGPGERMLDIGIGTGSFASRVARPDTEVWGVDPSPAMLFRCREDHPDYHLLEGHFLSLPVPDGAFHTVVSSFAFHHLAPADYEPAFREILRALVPGGRFVLLDVMFASESDRARARDALGELWDEEEVYPLVPEVEAAARQAGAAGLETQRVSPLHWAVCGVSPRGTGGGS